MEEGKATEATASGMAEDSKITPTHRERDKTAPFFACFWHTFRPLLVHSQSLQEKESHADIKGVSLQVFCVHKGAIPAQKHTSNAIFRVKF